MGGFHEFPPHRPEIDWAESGRKLIRERITLINEAARTGQPIDIHFENLIVDLFEHVVKKP